MLISQMEHFDVVFPLNLGPLTYRKPRGHKGPLAPGTLVRAEIKKSLKQGIVLGPSAAPPHGQADTFKEIAEVVGGPVLSPAMLKLISWMSEYYLTKEGVVLKGIFPREFFEGVRPRGKAHAEKAGCPAPTRELDAASLGALERIMEHSQKKLYRTFLLHWPSTGHEISFALQAARCMRNLIILCPGHADTRRLAGPLREAVGDRLAVLHSGVSRGRRADAVRRISAGLADIVLGSRSAVFAPLKEVSLIAVLREEDPSYKEEGGIRYNARDMAVMRGYLEGAPVLLSSICPSAESFHNAKTGKYELIETATRAKRPKVRLIDMRGARSSISGRLLQDAKRRLQKNERVMFLINRRGYSMLQCGDCGDVVLCGRCSSPLVFYKADKALRCHQCGLNAAPPRSCPRCGGLLRPSGAGVERLEEELKALNPLAVDSRRKAALRVLSEADVRLAIGTKLLARRPELGESFSLAGVLNADAYLYAPDFRSRERAFEDLLYSADRVSPGGELVLQSRNPGAPLFRYIRRFDFRGFYEDELREREALMYPPYSRMALITIEVTGEGAGIPPAPRLRQGEVEVLGPVPALTKRGKRVWKILLKSPTSKALRPAIRHVLGSMKGFKATVDVDPTSA
jgi:primosomal protein N' (replication factor Y)